MRMSRSHITGWVITAYAIAAPSASVAGPENVLKEKGLVVSSSGVAFAGEKALADAMKEVGALQRALVKASKAREGVNKRVVEATRFIEQMNQRMRKLNDDLAKVTTASELGKIESEMNKLKEQIEAQTKENEQAAKKAADEVSAARSLFVNKLLKIRSDVDKMQEEYKAIAEDEDVKEAVEALGKEKDKTLELGPSSRFTKIARDLAKLEEKIDSEEIEVRVENNIAFVDVILNGQHSTPMVFDSGASIVMLPFSVASEAGLTPTDADETIHMELADGRVIPGKKKIAESLKIGKFTIEQVECAVLDANAPAKDCLLGGNVLQEFTYIMDREAGRLTLTRIAGKEDSKAKATPSRRKGKAKEEPADLTEEPRPEGEGEQ